MSLGYLYLNKSKKVIYGFDTCISVGHLFNYIFKQNNIPSKFLDKKLLSFTSIVVQLGSTYQIGVKVKNDYLMLDTIGINIGLLTATGIDKRSEITESSILSPQNRKHFTSRSESTSWHELYF